MISVLNSAKQFEREITTLREQFAIQLTKKEEQMIELVETHRSGNDLVGRADVGCVRSL